MAGQKQIRVTADAATGKFRLAPFDDNGVASTQYVPDLMKSPTELTYVFDEPEVLQRLVVGLSGTDHNGRRISTATMGTIRNMMFQIKHDAHPGAESRDSDGGRGSMVDAWKSAVMAVPERHSVLGVRLQFHMQSSTDDEAQELSEMIAKVLSAKADRSVECVVVDGGECFSR